MDALFDKGQNLARTIISCCLPLMLLDACSGHAIAERIDSLAQVKSVYVESFTGGNQAVRLHASLVRQLKNGQRFRVLSSPDTADAIVKGSGQVWLRGYVAINPRNPGTDRAAVYAGYLSIEVDGAQGQPLWSWVVTPSRAAWGNVFDDLAGHAAKKLQQAASASSSPSPPPTGPAALVKTSLDAAGATFPAPLYQKWFEDFEAHHPEVRIRYSPVGSETGDEMLVAGKVDFAGSDVAPEVVVGGEGASHLKRIATVIGAVVPIYNLPEVGRNLRFTPQALADIYLGRVRRWNDPEIRNSNRDVLLPDAEITVLHRSDGSGTTWVWSDFLSKISKDWSTVVGRGTTLRWPVGTGAERNDGVAESVRNTPNAIGYVELTYAIQHQLSYGDVQNHAGQFVHADLDSLSEAALGHESSLAPSDAIDDSRRKDAYPITAFTWIVFPADVQDSVKRGALAALLRWILTSGQNECAGLGYAPLPREIAQRQLRGLGNTE